MTACPVPIADVKLDLGVDPADTSGDAWLQRRMNALWARMEKYCARPLRTLTTYEDDWGQVVNSLSPAFRPPAMMPPPPPYGYAAPLPYGVATPYLTRYPVQRITRFLANGEERPIADIQFDPSTGKLLAVMGPGTATDLSHWLVSARAKVTYVAGWSAIPDDLAEILYQCVAVQWSQRAAQQSGSAVGGFIATRITTQDLGSLELDTSPNYFVAQASKSNAYASVDPMLGVYAHVLDEYLASDLMAPGDWIRPVCSELGVAPSGGDHSEVVGDLPPANPSPGDRWWNSNEGRNYVYYFDGSKSQWVQEDYGT